VFRKRHFRKFDRVFITVAAPRLAVQGGVQALLDEALRTRSTVATLTATPVPFRLFSSSISSPATPRKAS
jgi:hypothetical protein